MLPAKRTLMNVRRSAVLKLALAAAAGGPAARAGIASAQDLRPLKIVLFTGETAATKLRPDSDASKPISGLLLQVRSETNYEPTTQLVPVGAGRRAGFGACRCARWAYGALGGAKALARSCSIVRTAV